MITPREIDCPNCGKPNEYSLGSCRGCGLEREKFDQIEQAEELLSEISENISAYQAVWRHVSA
jgi:rubredoxin